MHEPLRLNWTIFLFLLIIWIFNWLLIHLINLIVGKYQNMVVKSFYEANTLHTCWRSRASLKGTRSPKLARFFIQKDWKIFDWKSKMQTWIQWIYGPNFNLILFTYKGWSKPYSWTRESCHRKPYAILKKKGKKVQNCFLTSRQIQESLLILIPCWEFPERTASNFQS